MRARPPQLPTRQAHLLHIVCCTCLCMAACCFTIPMLVPCHSAAATRLQLPPAQHRLTELPLRITCCMRLRRGRRAAGRWSLLGGAAHPHSQ